MYLAFCFLGLPGTTHQTHPESLSLLAPLRMLQALRGTELWRMTANHLVSSALSASAYAPSPPVDHCQACQG